MALTYVWVTVLCVLLLQIALVTALALFFLDSEALQERVANTAVEYAQRVVTHSGGELDQLPPGFLLGDPRSQIRPGEIAFRGNLVDIPHIDTLYADERPITLALLVDSTGTVTASSYPGRYPLGTTAGTVADGAATLVSRALKGAVPASAELVTASGPVMAAAAPIIIDTGSAAGAVYVQVPIPPRNVLAIGQIGLPLLASGIVLVVLTAPIGLLFGVIATRGVVRRLEALARATAGFAGGDFERRVTPRPGDEIGQLEQHFNAMADQVVASVQAQGKLAATNARLAERSRISRELHDSISQDLFSLRMLAGGLRDALPAESTAQEQVTLIEQTLGRVHHEMRALLLELRPRSLEQQRLDEAIAAVAELYAGRLGVVVATNLHPPPLSPLVEQALLRIAQEAIANAVRHANAREIRLSLLPDDEAVVLDVADDGTGFDTAATTTHGLGLRLMRERVEELGGTLTLTSSRNAGTRIVARFPQQRSAE